MPIYIGPGERFQTSESRGESSEEMKRGPRAFILLQSASEKKRKTIRVRKLIKCEVIRINLYLIVTKLAHGLLVFTICWKITPSPPEGKVKVQITAL